MQFPFGISYDPTLDRLVETGIGQPTVNESTAGADGDVAPLVTLSGPNTTFTGLQQAGAIFGPSTGG